MTDEKGFRLYREGETTPRISFMIKLVWINRLYRKMLEENLRPLGHSVTKMEALGALLYMPKPVTQIHLAKRLRVEGATVTRTVDLLSEEGLVERIPDKKDRRVNHLALTAKGKAQIEEIFSVYDKVRDYLLGDFSDAQLGKFHKVLDHLVDRLSEPPEFKPDREIEPS